jgi:short-subunit dehydrogenase
MNISSETRAVITGASSGIGEALAIALGELGAKVALIARRKERLEAVAEKVRKAGGTPLVLQADVAAKEDIQSAMKQAIEEFGGIDILVNNAGRGNLASIEDTTPEQLESIFGVNVYSLWYTTAIALPVMKKQGSGHIMNVSSVVGKVAFPMNSAYISAKHATVGFTAALRTELQETGVEASVVCPAGVETEWAVVTEGGPIADIFVGGIQRSQAIAEERGIPRAPLTGMMSAAAVAEIMLEAIRNPRKPDVFTHNGTEVEAILAETDRRAVENQMLPLYLGMRQEYEAKHTSQ